MAPTPVNVMRCTFAYRARLAPSGSDWYQASMDFAQTSPAGITDGAINTFLTASSTSTTPDRDNPLPWMFARCIAEARADAIKWGWVNYTLGSGFTSASSGSGQILVDQNVGNDAGTGSLSSPQVCVILDKIVSPAVRYAPPGKKASTRTQAGRVFVGSPLNLNMNPYTGAITRAADWSHRYGLPTGTTPPAQWLGWQPVIVVADSATNAPAGYRVIDSMQLDPMIATQRRRVRNVARFVPPIP